MEYRDFLQMTEEELREITDDGSDMDASGMAYLELAHRCLQRGEKDAYLAYLDAAIDNGNREAADEKDQAGEERKQEIRQKEQEYLKRVEELRNKEITTVTERIRLAKEGDICAIAVCFETSLKQLPKAEKNLRDLAHRMADEGFSKEFLDKVLGEYWYILARAYEEKDPEKANECYKQAAEFNHLETLRLFRDGKIQGDYDVTSYRKRLFELGNTTDKFLALFDNITDGTDEDPDRTVLKLLNDEDASTEQYYEWAGQLLSMNQIDAACMLYERIEEKEPENSKYAILASFMLRGVNGDTPETLAALIAPVLENDFMMASAALERLISYALKMEEIPFSVVIKGYHDGKLTCLITSQQDTETAQKLFQSLTLMDIMPDRIRKTFADAHHVISRQCAVDPDMETESIWLDENDQPISPEMASLFLDRGLNYTDEKGSYVMSTEERDTYIQCTVRSIVPAQEENQESKAAADIYIGSMVNGKPEGTGTLLQYYAEDKKDYTLSVSLLSPNRILETIRENKPQRKYEGAFFDGETAGRGHLTRADGRQWIGEFTSGAIPHGDIHFIGSNGDYFLHSRSIKGKSSPGVSTVLKITKLDSENQHADGWAYVGETVYDDEKKEKTSQGQGVYITFKNLSVEKADIDWIENHIEENPFIKRQKGFFTKGFVIETGTIEEKCGTDNVFCDGTWENGKFKTGVKLTINTGNETEPDSMSSGTLLILDAGSERSTGKFLKFSDIRAEMLDRQKLRSLADELPYQWKFEGEVDENGPHGNGILTFPESAPCEGPFFKLCDRIIQMKSDGFADAELTIAGKTGSGMELSITDRGPELYVGRFEDGQWNDNEGFWGIADEPAEKLTYDELAKTVNGRAAFLQLKYKVQYTGQFVDGKITGTGMKKDDKGNWWKGTFRNGEIEEGKLIIAKKDSDFLLMNIFRGRFRNGQPDEGRWMRLGTSMRDGKDIETIADWWWDHIELFGTQESKKGTFGSDFRLKGEGEFIYIYENKKRYYTGTWNSDTRDEYMTSGTQLRVITDKKTQGRIVDGTVTVLSTWQPDRKCYLGKMKHFMDIPESSVDYRTISERYEDISFDWCFEGEIEDWFDSKPGTKGVLILSASHPSCQMLHTFMRDSLSTGAVRLEISDKQNISKDENAGNKKENLQMQATIHYPDGSVYTGIINKDYLPDGQGTLQKGDKAYTGTFAGGQRSGQGKLNIKGRTIYEGAWKDDHITEKPTLLQRRWKSWL